MSNDYATGRLTTADPSGVRTRDDLAGFVEAMLADLRADGADEWENPTLERYFDALAGFADARIADEPIASQETASWRLFAEILAAATGYE